MPQRPVTESFGGVMCTVSGELELDAICPDTVDPVELLEEVEMEPLAAELAVGDAVDPRRFQLRDHLGDRRVLDAAQLGVVDLAARPAAAGDVDRGRAQQAADVIGSERWCDLRHGRPFGTGTGEADRRSVSRRVRG